MLLKSIIKNIITTVYSLSEYLRPHIMKILFMLGIFESCQNYIIEMLQSKINDRTY